MDAQYFLDAIQTVIEADRARCVEKGYSFKERKAGTFTIGDLITAVLNVTDPEDARQFYASYVAFLNTLPDLAEPAEVIARSNIGWCFGEGMDGDRRAMWAQTTGAAHPVFGTTLPTSREAFYAGVAAGTRKA